MNSEENEKSVEKIEKIEKRGERIYRRDQKDGEEKENGEQIPEMEWAGALFLHHRSRLWMSTLPHVKCTVMTSSLGLNLSYGAQITSAYYLYQEIHVNTHIHTQIQTGYCQIKQTLE